MSAVLIQETIVQRAVPSTVAQLVAWLHQEASQPGRDIESVMDTAMELALPDLLRAHVLRRGFRTLLQGKLANRRARPAAELAVRNAMTGKPTPILERIQFMTAGQTRLISALHASIMDWASQRDAHLTQRAGHDRKISACEKIITLLKKTRATCVARLASVQQQQVEEWVLEGWQREDQKAE